MNDLSPLAGKRDALRARIEAAERRNADRTLADQAKAAADAAIDYTRENPVKVIGGAVALGVVIGLMTRSGRQAASKAARGTAHAISGVASSTTASARNLTSTSPSRTGRMVSDAVVAYALKILDEVMDAAREGKERAEDLGESTGKKAKRLAASTADAAETAADNTRALARKTADAAADMVRDLARKTRG